MTPFTGNGPLRDFRLFGLRGSEDFGRDVARELGISLNPLEERAFEDGEEKARPLESVREKDVYVLHSLFGDPTQSVNDKLCRLLFCLGALRDAGATRVTAVIPYLCYARKDRRTKSRDPVTTRYLAALFEAVKIDRIVTMDVHNLAAFQNSFRCLTEHLEALPLFVDFFAGKLADQSITVLAPDIGGVKRARRFRDGLQQALGHSIPTAFMEKERSRGVVSGNGLLGEIEGRTVLIVDDLISTGTTLCRTLDACQQLGAGRAFAVATHGLFIDGAAGLFNHPLLEQVVVTDTIPAFRVTRESARSKLRQLSSRPFFAEALRRMHTGGSLVELNREEG